MKKTKKTPLTLGKKHLLLRCAILCIQGYQVILSPIAPPCCRFTPTCSQYALEALNTYGLARGLFLAFRRILRCHPFHPGGYDPVT